MKDQGDWLKQVGELQQQYWNGWRDMTAQAMAAAAPAPATPWQDGMDAWARALGMKQPAATNPFFAFTGNAFSQADPMARLLDEGKRYLGLLQGMMAGDGFTSMQGGFDPRAWLEQMRSLHERFGQDLLGKVESAPWLGGLQGAQVEQLVKTFTGMPTHGMKQELQSWLDTPTFGLNREHQERAQGLASAWLDYLEAQKRYDELMLVSARRTFDLLEGKLAEREQPGRQIETARALYDLWIDAAEEAFAEVAMSGDYRILYGELVNTQMRVRAGINGEIERIGAQFGLPTRTEVDTLARQVRELKRELRRRNREAAAERAPVAPPKKKAPAAAPATPATARTARKAKSRSAGKAAQLVSATPASVSTRPAKSKRRPAGKPATSSGSKPPARRDDKKAGTTTSSGNVTPIIQSTGGKSGKRG